MSGFDNLNKRLQYHGGEQLNRLEQDKLTSLKSALKNSYYSETIVLNDEREFKCLINPDKLHPDYDNKIISIPYKEKCLNSEISDVEKDSFGVEQVGLKSGDVFTWKETNTHWMVYLHHLDETAYFRANIKKCEQEIQVNEQKYWVSIRGPVETSIPWNQKAGIEWNDMNYSLVMYITRDENTASYFKRFTKVKIPEPVTNKLQTWKVVGKNLYHGEGVIQLFLDEDFENSIQDAVEEEKKQNIKPLVPYEEESPRIEGPVSVYKYDTVTYKAVNFTEKGYWYLTQNGKRLKMNETSYNFTVDIVKSKGDFIVEYSTVNENAKLALTIQSI